MRAAKLTLIRLIIHDCQPFCAAAAHVVHFLEKSSGMRKN